MRPASLTIAHFSDAMLQAGIEPDCTICADGKLHRFRELHDKPGTRNGWYVVFPDYPPAGAFGCWRRGISERWSDREVITKMENLKRFESIEQLLDKDHQQGRESAAVLWAQSVPSNGKHGYLLSKGVSPHGTRYLSGALLIPVMDTAGQLHGVQKIYRDGSKRFCRFTNKRGHFFMLGSPGGNIIYVAEGFATAATIHEITGHTVVIAFDAGNLLPVAENLRKAYPEHDLILCADNDRHTEGNPGLTKAKNAAEVAGGRLVYPRFANSASHGTDFNDLSLEEGPDAVRDSLFRFWGA